MITNVKQFQKSENIVETIQPVSDSFICSKHQHLAEFCIESSEG